jgi:hypothetical protein
MTTISSSNSRRPVQWQIDAMTTRRSGPIEANLAMNLLRSLNFKTGNRPGVGRYHSGKTGTE